jgi:hypothetical protein
LRGMSQRSSIENPWWVSLACTSDKGLTQIKRLEYRQRVRHAEFIAFKLTKLSRIIFSCIFK